MSQPTSAMHRSILCVDVANFSDRRRTDLDQTRMRSGLYQALRSALSESGVRWDDCYREDRGDGALVLIPPEVPKGNLVTVFPAALATALLRHNLVHGPSARIRLRAALHAGEVRRDAHGVVGRPLILAFRLLDDEAVKSALRRSAGVLALVASDWFFEEVIRHEPAAAPSAYRPIQITAKGTRAEAWVYLPDQAGLTGHFGGWAGRPATAPRQLPAAVHDFVGREAEIARLTRLMDEAAGREAVMISVITGPAGVGKTALVVHWAHQVRDHFPDGELYLNLRGDDPGPAIRPEQALDWMLRALDVDAEKIPVSVEAKAALYRSILNGRRMLVVLDNAAAVQQVRPLVPGAPGCMVVVTSRSRLSAFSARDGARRIRLNRLAKTEAITLLGQIIGAAQVDAEPEAAAIIATRCDHLPLALRVAAERAATPPRSCLADVADELASERDRLDMLDTDDEYTGVRTAFSWSYRALPAAAARTFRLLGLHPGPDIGLDVVAALVGTTAAQARRSLDLLTGKNLVEPTAPGRFRLHALLHCYAEERARAEETDEDRSAAVRRMLTWYLHTADDAKVNLLRHFDFSLSVPDGPRRQGMFTASIEAQRWCETERLNLIAAIHYAADTANHDIAWRLTVAMTVFFYLRKCWADWITIHEVGLASARRLGDRVGEGYVLCSLGFASQDRHFEEAIGHFRRALDIFRETRVRPGQIWAICGIGHASSALGRFEESIEYFSEALTALRASGRRLGQSYAHIGLGYAYCGLRHFEQSIECFQTAMEFVDDDLRSEGAALNGLGRGHRGLGRIEESIDYYERALVVFAKIGDWWGQGEVLYNLGMAQADAGRREEARRSWAQAQAIFHDLHIDRETEVRALLDGGVTVSH